MNQPSRRPPEDSPRPPALHRPRPTRAADSPPNPVLKYLAYRRATVLFLGGLLAALLAAAAWFAIPSKYTAASLIRVSAEMPSLAAADTANRADFATYLKTQAAMIRSYGVLRAALLDPAVASLPMIREQPDPATFLAEELKVDYQEGSELVRLQLSGEDARGITLVVNAIQDGYFREIVEDEQRRKRLRLARIQETIDRMKDEVADRRGRAKPAAATTAGTAFGPQIAANQAARLREQLANADAAVKAQEGRVTALQLKVGQPQAEWVDPPNLPEVLDRDADVQRQNARIAAAQKRIDEYNRAYATIETARSAELREKLAEEEKARDGLRAAKAAEYRAAGLPALARDLRRRYDEAKDELARLRRLRRETDRQLAEYQAVLDAEMPAEKPADFDLLEIQDRQNLIAGLIDRANLLRIDLDAPPRVRPLQPAVEPQRRDNRRQLLGSLFAALLGFGLVGGGVVGFEMKWKRVTALSDIDGLAPVLGVLPAGRPVRVRLSETLQEVAEPTDHLPRLEEAVDTLRGRLKRELKRPAIIAVTSAVGEEGRTLLAWQLARSFQRGGSRTLLVDFDLRQPALHSYCGTDNRIGVCELLGGTADGLSAIRIVPDGLAFLSAGNWGESTRYDLTEERLESFANDLRKSFDFAVVNTHPLLTVAETRVLAGLADAILLSACKHSSRWDTLGRAREAIAGLNPALFGLVFSGAEGTECWT